MQKLVLVLAILLLAGCKKDKAVDVESKSVTTPPTAKVAEDVRGQASQFFTKWLEGHGHKDVVQDDDGVGLDSSKTRMSASLFGSKEHASGNGFLVETDFQIKLPDGQIIQEFVAGVGETEKVAIADSFANFTLTSFHVIHKAFIDSSDPHIDVAPIDIDGDDREILFGELYVRGGSADLDFDDVKPEIEAAIAQLKLAKSPHWIKIVYAQDKGLPTTVSVTLDNDDNETLTDAIAQMQWPKSDSFYMAKQFIIIR